MSRQQQNNKRTKTYILINLILVTLLLNSCGLFRGSSRVKTEEKVTDVVTETRTNKVSSEVDIVVCGFSVVIVVFGIKIGSV